MKILFVSAYTPYPPDTGGRIRSYYTLKWLAGRHEVHLLCFHHNPSDREALTHLQKLCREVESLPAPIWNPGPLSRLRRALFSPMDIVMPRSSPAMEEALRVKLSAEGFDLVHFDDMGTASYARLAEGFPTVLSKHNIEWVARCRALAEGRGATRAALRQGKTLRLLEGLALRRSEGRVAALFDRVVVTSEADRHLLARSCPLETIAVVHNGVDTDYFSPGRCRALPKVPGTSAVPQPDEQTILFVGAMFWPPNVDAALFFCDEVLPNVIRQVPEARFYLVGHDPPEEVRALGERPDVVVTGYVQDVRPYLAGAAIFVAPLRQGSGTRLKILEALAMGKAVVTTSIGREGLNLVNGRELVVADGAENLAEAIVALLKDPARRAELGKAGRQAVLARYSWPDVLVGLELVYEEAMEI